MPTAAKDLAAPPNNSSYCGLVWKIGLYYVGVYSDYIPFVAYRLRTGKSSHAGTIGRLWTCCDCPFWLKTVPRIRRQGELEPVRSVALGFRVESATVRNAKMQKLAKHDRPGDGN